MNIPKKSIRKAEIGTEEQSGSTNSFEEIEFYLNKIKFLYKK